MTRSLLARLSLALIASLLALLILQWIAADLVLRRITEQQVASGLEQDAQTLLAALSMTADGDFALESRYVAPIYLRPFSGHYYAVITPGRSFLSRSLWDSELAVERVAPGSKRLVYATGPQHSRLLMRVAGFEKLGQPITIAVAEDLAAFDRSMRTFRIGYALVSVIAAAALVFAQAWILRRGLASLSRVRADVRRLERGEIEAVGTDVPAEIAPLVSELNRLLVVLRQRVRRSRDALGNLAHALKTQLALLVQASEEPAIEAHPDLHARLLEPLLRIQLLTDRELRRARLAGGALPGQQVDIGAELERLASAMRAIYADKALRIEVDVAPDATFFGDTEDFVELVGNLLDNAAKFCSGRVHVTVRVAAALTVSVEDDGPGCAGEELQALTGRGVRADESLPGAGLGLAIARDIAEGYGGALRLGRSDTLGGFRAEATLPVAGDRPPAPG
jgi:signal transduction histidine kinase